MEKQKFREAVTDLMLMEYLPKLKAEVVIFMAESYPKQVMADEISGIMNTRVTVEMGELKIAEPSNEFIDKIVDLVYVKNK
ncbi:hypothetical protein KAR91_05235 [Candidatus Pacearchaeota archaeon]|nr:hypothetical protein [Candidatus Pacearchaeota archaeon]